jgi:hypothetical protein
MNIKERFKSNSPTKWKIIGLALIAASNATVQYFAADHLALRIIGAFMFAGYLITHLTVENKND